jgi:hypothetical protein
MAVILMTAASLMAAPSRASILVPSTSTAPEAGTQIAVTLGAQRVVDRLAGLKGASEHARIGADWQRVAVIIEAACECHEAPRHWGRAANLDQAPSIRGRSPPGLPAKCSTE